MHLARFRHMNSFLEACFTKKGLDECLGWTLKLADPCH